MRTVLIYLSKTGFTKRYAEWISQSLHCEAIPLKEALKDDLRKYNTVIYGGWIMGGAISGLNKVRDKFAGRLVVFAVGATSPSKENDEKIKSANNLNGIPFFYMQGGCNSEKLGFLLKTIFKMGAKASAKAAGKKPDGPLELDFDKTDKKYTEPLISYISSENT